MANAAGIEKLREQMVQRYRALPEIQQKIIQLFSVNYGPVSRATFLECLNQTGARHTDRKPFVAVTLRTHLEALLSAGFLLQERSQGPQCHPLLCEIATRDAVKANTFDTLVNAVEKCIPIRQTWSNGPRSFSSEDLFVREVRIGIYRKDVKFIEKQFEDYYRYSYSADKISLDDILLLVCSNPFDADWFLSLPPQIYSTALVNILENGLLNLISAEPELTCLQTLCREPEKIPSPIFPLLLTEQLLYRGRLEEAQESLKKVPSPFRDQASLFEGQLALLRGDHEMAIAHYTQSLKAFRKSTGKRKAYFDTFSGVLFVLALIKESSAARLAEAEEYATLTAKQPSHWLGSLYRLLVSVIKVQQGNLSAKNFVTTASIAPYQAGNSVETLLSAMCLYWVDVEAARAHLPALIEPLYREAEASGYRWLAMEAAELLSRVDSGSAYGAQAAAFRQVNGNLETLVNLIQPRESWEICLNALANLSSPSPTATSAKAAVETPQRLIWLVTFMSNCCMLQPREQKISAKGAWTKGRPVALKRLHDNPESFDYLTPHDRRVCQQIESDHSSHRYYGTVEYDFSEKANCRAHRAPAGILGRFPDHARRGGERGARAAG